MSQPFSAGDLCLLIDGRGRHYLVTLSEKGVFQYHAGALPHIEILGSPPGTMLRSTADAKLIALRPRLAEYVLKMPRGAQVIYPKDLGPMIHWGDIAPGQTVIEAGTGSGALTLALLRAVGAEGTVITVERRDDHREHAIRTISRFLGDLPTNLVMLDGEVEGVFADHPGADRLMLDLPEPWTVVGAAAGNLAPGAVVTTYLPTVPQIQRLSDALRHTGWFATPETFEGLHREWKIENRSVRPQTQMVGHTGFITVVRHLAAPINSEDPAE